MDLLYEKGLITIVLEKIRDYVLHVREQSPSMSEDYLHQGPWSCCINCNKASRSVLKPSGRDSSQFYRLWNEMLIAFADTAEVRNMAFELHHTDIPHGYVGKPAFVVFDGMLMYNKA